MFFLLTQKILPDMSKPLWKTGFIEVPKKTSFQQDGIHDLFSHMAIVREYGHTERENHSDNETTEKKMTTRIFAAKSTLSAPGCQVVNLQTGAEILSFPSFKPH